MIAPPVREPSIPSEDVDRRKSTKFNPFLPYEAFYWLLFFVQWAIVCRTEDVVDSNTVVRERVQGASILDTDTVQDCASLYQKATAFREDLWRSSQEHAR